MTSPTCNSCNKEVTNIHGSASFSCPQCSKYDIVRCMHCRQIVAKYTCPQCGFIGPN